MFHFHLWRWLLGIARLLTVFAVPAAAQPPDLTPEEQAHIAAANLLITSYGETAWPGFTTPPPLLLRTQSGEFLIGQLDPPAGFVPVAGLEIAGEPVYYTDTPLTPDPFASSWLIGNVWAAALPVRDVFQAMLDENYGENFITLDATNYVRVQVHEMFHAYQLNLLGGPQNIPPDLLGPDKMEWVNVLNASELIGLNSACCAGEGAALRAALEAETDEEVRAHAAEFLRLRQERYDSYTTSYAPDLMNYERSVEWIEGQARYVEVALILHAPELDEDRLPMALEFQDPDTVWIEFLDQLDYPGAIPRGMRERYTTLGAGQAFVLDRLLPGWQTLVLDDGLSFEAVFRRILRPNR